MTDCIILIVIAGALAVIARKKVSDKERAAAAVPAVQGVPVVGAGTAAGKGASENKEIRSAGSFFL